MVVTSEVAEYLKGTRFSNGARIDIRQEKGIVDRINFLETMVRGTSVIHLGFADHLPLLEAKIKSKLWLHKRLVDSATRCIGIDIDAEAVSTISQKLQIPGLYQHDVIADPPLEAITSSKWDYFIIGEVLEHIDNPVSFLAHIRQKYGAYVSRFVITVPNAWDIENFSFLVKSQECINTDHRYWFTPFTLAKVCVRAGYNVEECRFISNGIPNRWRSMVLKTFPSLQSGLLIVLKP